MATATVAADLSWLAERGLVVGARVGSCTKAYAPFGTVAAVRSTDAIVVAWDDATTETVAWTAISPLGYVVEAAPVAASASQWASAATHLERRADWRTVRVAGVRYVVLTSGNSGRIYRVRADAAGCECRWYERTWKRCSHMLALELAALADELVAAQETVADSAVVFPTCRACRAVFEGPGALCDDCAAEQTRRLEIASKRAAVAA